ncbi:hypothetical protein LTR97_004068 [Elasticomyces elasticus]|uniref:Uncharacterized protein n=1 Tax=Elasticomyces elasticus TaxID=574655 RepID=A0AAN7VUR3_9PEZI|nr:hypothetical protein LTR97_004068 [Elasticomyces elasticus]
MKAIFGLSVELTDLEGNPIEEYHDEANERFPMKPPSNTCDNEEAEVHARYQQERSRRAIIRQPSGQHCQIKILFDKAQSPLHLAPHGLVVVVTNGDYAGHSICHENRQHGWLNPTDMGESTVLKTSSE